MLAVLFPGQGSQYVGMGSDFYEKFDDFKKNFDIVDKTLNYSLTEIIQNGPDEKLKMTQNTQPAIMVLGVSIYNLLVKKYSFISKNLSFFAGHSLGEYTALVCSGSLSLEKAAYLLHERGKAMQEAVPAGEGAMTAVLGMSINEVEQEIRALEGKGICEIANDNTNGQVVVSGEKSVIESLNINIKKKKKRGLILPVSAPFHCSMMKKAAELMKDKINNTIFLEPKPKIISNVTAKEENNGDLIKSLLIKQITARVRWRESVNYMIQKGVNKFIEIGPGKVLTGLVKKINSEVDIKNVNSIEDVENYKLDD
jgi:[acyl-carrier-protein] S-malonyltransferase